MTLILYSGNSHTESQGFENFPDLVCADFAQRTVSEKGIKAACKALNLESTALRFPCLSLQANYSPFKKVAA